MVRVSVMYPRGENKHFDIDYYRTKHMEIVDRVMPTLGKREVDQGVDGPYMAVGHLYFDSMEDLQKSVGSAGEAIADIPSFTNIEPKNQISEIVDS